MPDAKALFLGMAVLIGVGLVVALAFILAARRGRALAAPNSPGQRLAVLARQRPDYRIWVGVPPERPIGWAVASRVAADAVAVEGRGEIPLAEVRAFVVAYANGQMIDCELAGLPVPAGLTALSPARRRDSDVPQAADLEEGREYIMVKYGPSQLKPRDRNHYSTTLTNVSEQRIRVLKFAGYTRTADGWKLNTVTGTFYSAREFREWYGLGPNEWLGPGESACDSNNYGGPPVLWAYYCQAEDGREFVAAGVRE
jgi:hypothetical protein